jgi:uncharacterized protein involved in exopolysaccharide biosynthesis
MIASLRRLLSERKWILWVVLVALLAAAFAVGVSLLPRHDLNSLQQVENQSNGVQPLQRDGESG